MLIRRIFKIILLASIYFFTARFGLSLSPEHKFATLIWPPTGISLTALLIFGLDLWPGVALGAFLTNWSLGAPLAVAFGMMTGNTLEALIGATFLTRMDFHRSLSRLKDVIAFILGAAFFSTLFSATFGVTSLYLGGVISGEAYSPTWVAWWVGDVMGDLIIAPLFLVWAFDIFTFKITPKRIYEIIGWGVFVVVSVFLLFTDFFLPTSVIFPHPYFLFPLLMIIAMRFELRGTVIALLFVSIVVVGSIASGHSRFWMGVLTPVLLLQAQVFLGILAISKLVLSAVVRERREEFEIRERFMSMLGHDLRSPITAIRMMAQIITRDQGMPDSLLKSMGKIQAHTDRADRMITNLLDSSRIHAGQNPPLQMSEFEFTSLVQATMDDLVLIYGKRFNLKLPGKHIYGYWDSQAIRRILENLCTNSIKYGLPQENITVTISERADKVYLSVHNFGKVITRYEKQELFSQFRRTRSVVLGEQPSWGIGLPVVKALTESHGGLVTVESTEGFGTTFTIELPKDSRVPQEIE